MLKPMRRQQQQENTRTGQRKPQTALTLSPDEVCEERYDFICSSFENVVENRRILPVLYKIRNDFYFKSFCLFATNGH